MLRLRPLPSISVPDVVRQLSRIGRHRNGTSSAREADGEFKLPKMSSLVIMIVGNVLLQLSFFIVVSSSNDYAHHLGGNSTFAGVVIGIPTVFSGLALIPMTRYDKGLYKRALHICCFTQILGLSLYSLAYVADYLYLILIGRIISGIGMSMFMYSKRYCSDPLLVGVRRRTTLASWLVIGQGIGMTLGPFAGGLLYKIGFSDPVFNGFTSPSWLLGLLWCIFWIAAHLLFEDPQPHVEQFPLNSIGDEEQLPPGATTTLPQGKPDTSVLPPSNSSLRNPFPSSSTSVKGMGTSTPSDNIDQEYQYPSPSPSISSSRPFAVFGISLSQLGVIVCMCWFAMTNFFILGGWESNLPVFGASYQQFGWSPYAAGNFIALGGITTFPFLVLNVFLARRLQDRHILAFGVGVGTVALFVFISLLKTNKITYGSAFACWWAVALGFNIASTVTNSLLGKQLPPTPAWNSWCSMVIQYSNYTGRVTGAVWGGSGVAVGMLNYVGVEIAIVGIGVVMVLTLWKNLKAKTG